MEIDVRRIAALARLKIPNDKLDGFTEEMAKIVKMVENLPELDGAGALLDPDDTMTLRADEVQRSAPQGDILRNAPQTSGGCFLVPKTVD